jgi:hypothetical protein
MQELLDETKQNAATAYQMFKFSIRSELTCKYYERRIRTFFNFIGFHPDKNIDDRCNAFASEAINNPNWSLNKIILFLQFQKDRAEHGEITPATVSNFVKALKIFCETSEIPIPWKRIVRGLPRPRMASNDRAPTVEEIQKLMEYPDRRIKPIVKIMASSGIRIGAFDYLQWKHIIPINDENNENLAAKIIVYAGDIEQYYSFITPEAYKSLKDWMDFRASYGETITGESWIMRDIWQTTNSIHGAIDLLTIGNNNKLLERQILELKEKNKTNDTIILQKLAEKDKQIELLMKNQEKYDLFIESFIDSGQLKPKR